MPTPHTETGAPSEGAIRKLGLENRVSGTCFLSPHFKPTHTTEKSDLEARLRAPACSISYTKSA
jgi:hypothetical protein